MGRDSRKARLWLRRPCDELLAACVKCAQVGGKREALRLQRRVERYIRAYISILPPTPHRPHCAMRLPHRLIAAAAALLFTTAAQAAELTVAAAASLTDAFKAIAPLFEAHEPGTTVRLTFGASGALLP